MTRRTLSIAVLFLGFMQISSAAPEVQAQQAKPSGAPEKSNAQQPSSAEKDKPKGSDQPSYSGMYTFLKEGEFVQVTVEDEGSVTGFISRFGDHSDDKGSFVDQFFKTGRLDGKTLTFTTQVVQGVAFDFRGTVERGDGKNPGDDAYYVLKGTLKKTSTDANKKTSSQSQEVALKMFPQDAAPQ